jgi:signal transduction histidine kinase
MAWVSRVSLSLMLLVALATAAPAEPKRVLLLHSFGPEFVPWVFFSGQFREALIKHSPDKIDLYEASLEGARFQPPEQQGPIIDYLHSLFAERKLDLIVAMGAPATFFVQRYRTQFFQQTPMIIAASEQRAVNTAELTENDTFVGVTLDFNKWIENILEILPNTRHIAWAVGASPLERFWTEELRRTSQPFANRVTFDWFNDLSFEDMLKRVSVLPPNSAIFYVDLRMDAAGVPLDKERVLPRLHEASSAPIFSYVDSYLGQGIVGGPLLSSQELGERIATVGIRILGGEAPSNIRMPPLAMGRPKYDWRELQHWNISESRLPAGSEILFREPSVWEHYRLQILIACGLLLAQASLISWLIYEHRRRNQAEAQSRQSLSELAHMNRVASAGVLSASIAHEVKQPLTGMVTRANAALRWLSGDNPNIGRARDALGQIVTAGHRASDIVTNVRAMFDKDKKEVIPIDLNKLIRTVLGLVYIDLRKYSIESQVNLSDPISPVIGNQVQLQQVILNLVMNAIESMNSAEPRVLSIKCESTEHGTVLVSIGDTGSGIEIANLSRIFEPMFTTKARGMGMGLSICKSIIESHRGRIWVSAAAPRGSIFQFELPVHRPDERRSDLSEVVPATPIGGLATARPLVDETLE